MLMDCIEGPEHGELIKRVYIYDLLSTLRASGYPMATKDLDKVEPDLNRAKSLSNSPIGSGHDNFLTGIRVGFDLTFTNKAWVEAERYHFFDIVSSQSTMHRIAKFDLDKAYNEYVDLRIKEIIKELVSDYNEDPTPEKYLKVLYSNPAGFKLTARISTNYRQLRTIYNQRKDHRLPEWREFCEWIKTLPCSGLIVGDKSKR